MDSAVEDPTIKEWLGTELHHAKYSKVLWGRDVIRAIDMDDCTSLNKCMCKPGANINTQVDILGYDQYLWTCMIHKYLGDTALHLAMRQKKMMCVHVLLILKARTDIPNQKGETADSLSIKLFGTTAKNLEYEAYKFLLNRLPHKDIPGLPDEARYRQVEKDAWKLMEQGRILHSELPRSFGGADPILDRHLYLIRKNYLSFNLSKKVLPGQEAAPTEAEQAAAAATAVLAPEAAEAAPPVSEWVIKTDAKKKQYYFNQVTGESTWEKPEDFDPPSPTKQAAGSKPGQASTSSKKGSTAASATSSASSSRAGSPGRLPTSPSPSRPASRQNAPPPSTSAKGKPIPPSKVRGKGASADEASESGDSLSRKKKASQGKKGTKAAAVESDSEDSDDSSAASSLSGKKGAKGSVGKKGSASGRGGKDIKAKKKKKAKKDEEPPPKPKPATPPRPRTLREQYEDAGAPMSQRAEIEVLREDCRLLGEQLKLMVAQGSVGPGVSVPPLPEDFAAYLIEQEQKFQKLQNTLAEKSRAYYGGTRSLSPEKQQRAALRAARRGRLAGENRQPSPGPTAVPPAALAKTKTGVPNIPAAARAGTGDVWGRDNLCDVIYLIERQKAVYFEKLAASRQPVSKGLKLLDSVKASNAVDRIAAHEQKVAAGRHDPMYISEELEQLQGVKKLKFINLTRLRAMAQGEASLAITGANRAQPDGSVDPKADKEKRNMASRLSRAVSDKILYHQESYGGESLESVSLTGTASRVTAYTQRRHFIPQEPEYEVMRNITLLSTRTNMRYMKIGDEGAESLAKALTHDEIVTDICLAGARISSAGMSLFAKQMPEMKALRYLDLCNNAICDKGAAAVAAALPYCVLLEQCNLAGNRITGVGAVKLIQAVFQAPLTWLSLKNNKVVGEEEQVVLKLLEEHNYTSEQKNRIFEHNPPVSVNMHLTPAEEEPHANSSMQDGPRVLKMFIL